MSKQNLIILENILSKKPKILMIEDHPMMVKIKKGILKQKVKYQELSIPVSFKEAEKVIRNGSYDLVILDQELGNWPDSESRTGSDLIPLIKEYNPNSFIFLDTTNKSIGENMVKNKMVDFYQNKEDFANILSKIKS